MRVKAVRSLHGVAMLEVLVTLVIVTIGLLGLVGLQSRLQVSEMESYQRSQALLLLNDMAQRIATNRVNAASYVTTTPLGVGVTCPTTETTTLEKDQKTWCQALQGAAEANGGVSVGAMIGGRGCVQAVATNEYLVTVAWQGLIPLSAPAVTCGQNEYNGATGSSCNGDLCRRVVTTVVRIGSLSSLP